MVTEMFGGLGLILGFLTRIPALGIAVEMVGAIFLVHLPNGFFMNWAGNQKGEGFEYHLLAIAVAATLLLRGAGAYSVDRALTK
jgi:putative oxidoreductase